MTPTPTATPTAPVSSTGERCDRCGAQAQVRVILPGGGDLVFCAHHARAHEARLREVAVSYLED
ncbi:MAG: hypothetical protein DLM56_13520 [Pseudonocardiales bacterium]|nr:MAG: hypothetical protein DLM56_13520 [Pseudonocardiales bacterium]